MRLSSLENSKVKSSLLGSGIFRSSFNTKFDKELYRFIRTSFGVKPRKASLYKEALRHKSSPEFEQLVGLHNNERLEFLGDAILNLCVAQYLYDNYNHEKEGFLTKLRSRIVSRKHLNELAAKIKLHRFVKHDTRMSIKQTSVGGNALEALIGAIYLDLGFAQVDKVIQKQIIEELSDLEALEKNDENFKSILLEWSQAEGKELSYQSDFDENNNRRFQSIVSVDGESIATGKGRSKKDAEQEAARLSILKIGVPQP